MKKIIFVLAVLIFGLDALAQTPKQVLYNCYYKFSKLNDFKADAAIHFDVPGLNMKQANGKILYRKPNKFRIKLMGIAFLPKQNPFESINGLADTNTYVAVSIGNEKINQVSLEIINIIPLNQGDLITGKFWVNRAENLIYQYELTTRSSGTVMINQKMGEQKIHALPDEIKFTFDVSKFKIPKGIAMDINSAKKKSLDNRKTGTIIMNFAKFVLNKKIKDIEFTEE
ncbi:MAG: hypothetical protein IPK03_08655 [Bacteroidetes bacterium]|nr:hypothetical protein [Bacteroidota bacterium]